MKDSLPIIGKRIAAERKMDWHSGFEKKLWNIENSCKDRKMTREEALRHAARELKIDKSYDPHYKSLNEYLKRYE
ncbi:MAG: hypothetical protein A2288_00150 [Candidatus Moranbacteria bacterium RIFOXYA12_FULL_44_15]|nr:MAG: hypothetical protein A2288_00150 [Candidatus Moranbacteria bacterium RIFOXYA12_FULL_44_15]OGI36386.1 MAG: hypothetical protein A2259_00670 [Candidatus Moranbacteria bacterium RIFOXYA2_FULL_43_15]